jgi:Derlin-2/3
MAPVILYSLEWFFKLPTFLQLLIVKCLALWHEADLKCQTFNYYFDITYSPMHPPLSALILAMCYTVTQDQRGMKTQVYFVTIPAQLLPYCMILLSLFMGHDLDYIILQFEGLLAAHLYDFLTRIWPEFGGGTNYIPTPGFLSRVMNTPRVLQRSYGTAIRSTASSSGRDTGAEAGPLPDSWRTRGSGQRLG